MRLALRLPLILALVACLLTGCSRDPNVRKHKYFESGQRYFEKGKYREAAIQFSNAAQVDPSYADAHYQLALTYLKLQQWSRAYQELSRVLEIQPENYKAHIDAANMLISAREFKQAKDDHLDLLVQKVPNDPDVHMALANYYAGLNNLPTALQEMQKAIALDPKRSELYLNQAMLQFSAEQYDAAEASLKQATTLAPKDMNALLALGSFYQRRGRLPEAEAQFRHAIEVDRKSTDPRSALVRLLVLEGNKNEAEKVLRQAKLDFPDDSMGYSMLGDYYFSMLGDVDRATTEYESLYKDHPKDLRVKKNFIQLLILKNRLDEARKLNDEILKGNPQDGEALVYRGQIKLREGHADEAVDALQTALRNDPDNGVAHYHLGTAFEQLGNVTRAEGEWRDAVRLNPELLEAHRSLAKVAIRKGDWNGLYQIASTLVEKQPGVADGYALRAIADMNLKQTTRAEQDINKAIEVAPQNPIGYIQMGSLRLSDKRFTEAESAYQKALDLDAGSSDALSGLMNTYLAQKQTDKAVAAANSQIAKSPNNSAFYDLLGTALYNNKKDYKGAEDALRKATALDKYNSDARLKLGQVLNAEGQPDQAIATYQEAIKDNPHDIGLYIFLGGMYETKQDWSNAKTMYQKALEIQSDNPLASNNLAYVMLQQGGNVDVALAMAQTARRGMPDSPNTADTLGWAYYQKGAYNTAIDLFKEALRKNPNDATFHYHLGLAYQKAEQPTSAKEHLKQVLKINPNFANADDVRKALSELGGA